MPLLRALSRALKSLKLLMKDRQAGKGELGRLPRSFQKGTFCTDGIGAKDLTWYFASMPSMQGSHPMQF